MNTELDEMIKNYSEELMRFAKANNIESLVIKNEPEKKADKKETIPENEPQAENPTLTERYVEEAPYEAETQKDETDPHTEQTAEIPREEDLENFAYFKARVFAALGAFAIENAKVILYKNDVLHAFLVTDKNGETQTIKIEAYPEENSLEPLSDEQRIDYSADVYAEGFAERKNLLVSAVGGSDIMLDIELTPESEAVN